MTRTSRVLLPLVCVLLWAATAFAGTLSGIVTDRTTGKPAAGDTIAVINMAQSMDEIAKATSDAQGRFQVNAPDGGQILLHITHRGADYFKTVEPGVASAQVDVYDSAARIDGIGGEALVLRAETDASGKTLNLAENFFVQNASTPPRTEFGGNTFDFYLPKAAHISQTLASPPGGLLTNAEVKTIDAASGHYAFTFPVRPGETRFQVAYSLPYNGRQAFSLKLSMQTGDVAVMLPKTMQFQGSAQFQPLNQDTGTLTFDAHEPVYGQPVQFAIAGSGQLPRTQDMAQGGTQADGGQPGNGAPAAAGESRPGGGLAPPDDPNGVNDPWAKYKWWILSVLGLALVVGAGVMLKAGQPSPAVAFAGVVPSLPPAEGAVLVAVQSGAYAVGGNAAPTAGPGALMRALRDELFELETDRLAGRLSEAGYAEQRAAFDVVLRRAMSRSEASPGTSNE